MGNMWEWVMESRATMKVEKEGPMGSWMVMMTHEQPNGLEDKPRPCGDAIIWESSPFFQHNRAHIKDIRRQNLDSFLGLLVLEREWHRATFNQSV